MAPKVGDTLQFAIWATGDESQEVLRQFDLDIEDAFARATVINRIVLGPVVRTTLYPGDPQVPPVPDRVQGPDVRLLVAEAEVIAVLPKESRFLSELEPKDLKRLRKITRAEYAKIYPGVRLTDRQCDTLINDLGPEAAMDALRSDTADILKVL